MDYKTGRTTAPAVEPITTAEAKSHLRIDHSVQDTMISGLVKASREYAEYITGRAFVYQVWTEYFKKWPDEYFELSVCPLLSVTHVKYTDIDGATTTMSSDDYSVDTVSEPGRVVLGYDKDWPTASMHEPDYPIEIQYICGYSGTGDSPVDLSNIPEAIKIALRLQVELLYGGLPEQYAKYQEKAIDSLLMPYKIWRF